MRRVLLLAGLALLVGFACSRGSAIASAPSGTPPADAEEAFQRADTVFQGTVMVVRKDALGFASVVEVEVEDVWKARHGLTPRVVVDGSGGPTYPARVFRWFERYLFYVDLTNQPAEDRVELAAFKADSVLHRVVSWTESAHDFEFLASRQKASSTAGQLSSRLLRAVAAWRPCRGNDECVSVTGICGGWEAVPRAFESDLSEQIQNINAAIDCISRTVPKPTAICREGMCVTE